MATATAPQVSKTEIATGLRAECATLTKEVSQLRDRLEHAEQQLGALEDKRRALAEAVADGKPQKIASAEIHAQILDAGPVVEVLQRRLTEKQTALNQSRDRLAILDREIVAEAQQAARQIRFAELEKQGNAAADVIAGKLRALLEVDFPALDSARDALVTEFIGGRFSTGSVGPEAQAARALMHALRAKLVAIDDISVAERVLLREKGFSVNGDISFTVRNLKPPKP